MGSDDVAALDAEIDLYDDNDCSARGPAGETCLSRGANDPENPCTACLLRAYQAATRAALEQVTNWYHEYIDKAHALTQRCEAAEARLAQVEQERDALNEAVTEACKDRDFYDTCLREAESRLTRAESELKVEKARLAQVEAALTSHAIQCPQCQDAALAVLRERPPA